MRAIARSVFRAFRRRRNGVRTVRPSSGRRAHEHGELCLLAAEPDAKLAIHRMRNWSLARLFGRLGAALLVASLVTACEPSPRRDRTQATRSQAAESDAPYQAEVEEGLGAAVAI